MIKVAIIGCRGIPNHYGGFGQLAEYLSVGLVEMGYLVTVYNSHNHPYQKKEWRGVDVVHVNNPEDKIGTIGQFVYDFHALRHARKSNCDVILQLGYTSSSIWFPLLPKRAKVATNMDGLEWKRRKFSKPVQYFLKLAEYLAAISSSVMVADSKAIESYLKSKYKRKVQYIAYGAHLFDAKEVTVPERFGVHSHEYDLLVARMEPENHIAEILEAKSLSNSNRPLLVVGNTQKNNFGKRMKDKYASSSSIRFTEGIYDIEILNKLRYHSRLYIHGHSVGGTNPSLLEAMASNGLILAHDNAFNRAVLEENGYYFKTVEDLRYYFDLTIDKNNHSSWIDNNRDKIREQYSWPKIIEEYHQLIQMMLGSE